MAKFKSLRRLIGFSGLGLLVGLLVAGPAMALDLSIFSVSQFDKSKEYLGILFGPVGSLGLIGISPVFGNIFGLFNGIVLSLTLCLVAYITISGAIQTAQEGEILGKKWSMIMVPLRAVLGMYLLIPDPTGYSGIQVFFMWMILNGVGAANTMWEMLIEKIGKGENVAPNQGEDEVSANDRKAVAEIFSILICQEYINAPTNPASKEFREAASITSDVFQIYPSPTGTNPSTGEALQPDRIISGVEGNAHKKCGEIISPNYKAALAALAPTALEVVAEGVTGQTKDFGDSLGTALTSSVDASIREIAPLLQSQMVAGLIQITDTLQPFAEEAAISITDPTVTPDQKKQVIENMLPVFNVAVTRYAQLQKLSDPASYTVSKDMEKMVNSARKNGWMFAGSYYFKLVKASANISFNKQTIGAPGTEISVPESMKEIETNFRAYGYAAQNNIFSELFDKMGPMSSALITASTDTRVGGPTSSSLTIGKRTVQDQSGSVKNMMSTFNKVRDRFLKDTENIMLGNTSNPLASVAALGGKILFICDMSWIALLIISFVTALAAYTTSCANSAGYAFGVGIKLLYPVVAMLITILYSAGMMMAVYLPLIPYLVYTFATIGWIFAVTEAMVAAPLVAMSIAAPSEDELGKAGHALLLLTNLFLRPTFIVIGLIAGARLLVISIEILTFSFRATVSEMVGNTGMFGIVPLIVLYATMISTLANKAFSIIYLLPDHVIRWLGGQAEGYGEGDLMSQAKEGTQKAADATGKTVGSTTSGAGQMASGAMSANRKKE